MRSGAGSGHGDCAAIEHLFALHLGNHYRVRLVGGASEPLYEPASADSPAAIHYTGDHLRSALHEIAHWCIAGESRRQLVDYGYWYVPDGRNAREQLAFQTVEARPQALELLFCAAMGIPFRVSLDNLGQGEGDSVGFEARVLQEARNLMPLADNPRAACWIAALAREHRGTAVWNPRWVADSFRSWRGDPA